MHIVLVEPQIPQNTGSIARTCAATGSPLHLIEPLGFEITEKAVRRAGLDYWPHVNLHRHCSWQAFIAAVSPTNCWFFSKFGSSIYSNVRFQSDDALIFGSETKGLGEAFLSTVPSEQILKIPINTEHVRSLNLSNAVSIALYEGLRQQEFNL